MPYYLYQWTYKDPALKAMCEAPQDRPAELRKAVEAFGGKLHQFFYALGPCDGIAIVEFPDNECCVACSLTLGGHGGNTTLSTTVLLTPGEGYQAMVKANRTSTGYRAPVGYASHG
jgi:uncharacterized protein with GYD domain